MGNCAKSNVVKPHPKDDNSSPSLNNFRVTVADVVKEKSGDINNSYTFLELLGKGAFGEVKKAVHKVTGITRAVKIISRKSQDPLVYEQMLNEIQVLKILDHPHIMKVIEYYQDEAKLYLVCEFYDGEELFDKIMKQINFTESQAAGLMKQILLAINYCHKNNIMHRDLKPENIIYESKKADAPLKIIDFGTSQVFRANETLQKPLGTCYYVAPEVLKKKYTEKCDVWSCGVIMYFMLAGHPPFMGATENKVLQNVIQGVYEFPREEFAHITSEAIDLIKKLLEYDPDKRYTAEQALNHPWFTQMLGSTSPTNKNHSEKALKNLQEFRAGRKLQEAVWVYLVSYFSTKEDTSHLLKLFQAMDTDKNGVLTRKEILDGYKNILGKGQNNDDIEEIINKIDYNNNGVVDYSEFITATINKMTLLSKARLEATFQLFDKDGSGHLSVDELKAFLNPEQFKFGNQMNNKGEIIHLDEDKIWENIMNQVDKNSDGVVSLKEFKDLMLDMAK